MERKKETRGKEKKKHMKFRMGSEEEELELRGGWGLGKAFCWIRLAFLAASSRNPQPPPPPVVISLASLASSFRGGGGARDPSSKCKNI